MDGIRVIKRYTNEHPSGEDVAPQYHCWGWHTSLDKNDADDWLALVVKL